MTWTPAPPSAGAVPGDNEWGFRGVSYANGWFYAFGGSCYGRMHRSRDGVQWEEISRFDGQPGNSTCTASLHRIPGWIGGLQYGNGIYVAVGGNGMRARSTDGVNWTDVHFSYRAHYRSLAFGNGVFVAVGDTGERARSTDGITWTHETNGGAGFSKVAYGGGWFVAIGGSRRVRSQTGMTWTEDAAAPYGLSDVTFAEDRFVALAGSTGISTFTIASLSWQDQTPLPGQYFSDVSSLHYANGLFVGTGWQSRIYTSTDARNWVIRRNNDGGAGLGRVVYGAP